MKIHYFDIVENMKVPEWNDNKIAGYKIAKCGFQRECCTVEILKVTCKICLKKIKGGLSDG